MKKRLMQLLVAGLVLILSSGTFVAAKDIGDGGGYTQRDREYYLTEEQIAFVRPGLELEILDVTIPEDLQPEVWFKLSDPEGLPLDRDGITTPGPISTSFILSYIPQGGAYYVNYSTRVQTSPITGDSATQATTDSGGVYTTVATGEYIYKFGTVLPADYDADATHTLGIYARRDLLDFDLDRYVSNELEHFVPSGSAEPEPRSIVTTETCNARCHDPLAIHGGSRQEVGLCILCHNATQTIDPDTGDSVFMPYMVHKIHAGANLANGYTIVGYRQSVHDYSHVEYPAELNDCEVCHTGGTPTEAFPMVADPPQAMSCNGKGKGATTIAWKHDGPVQVRLDSPDGKVFARGSSEGSKTTGKWVDDGKKFFLIDRPTGETIDEIEVNTTVFGCAGTAPGTFRGEPGVDHTAWMTEPSRMVCGSCHDDVNFETGEGHSANNFPQDSDDNCTICHRATGPEYGTSVRGTHTVFYKSNQLPGIYVDVKSIRQTAPGQFVRVIFALSDKNGPMDPSELQRLRFSITGPNEDFDVYIQEDVLDGLTRVGPNWSYRFETPLPNDAEGSFTLGVEGRTPDITVSEARDIADNDQMQNFAVPFAVTDETAVPRRMVVDDYQCESCHSNLSLHGSNRHEPQYCVTCHQPEATDEEVRNDGTMPESIHFKYMIHKIHRGEELERGYVVYGYRSSVHDYGHVEYPGDLRNCEKCHVEGDDTYLLPLPEGVLATETNYDFWTPTEPQAAACLSCHDSEDAAAHADANTTMVGESCSACHGEGKAHAVERVHAR